MENPNFGKLTSMHFYAWESGLKTGMYYLRTKAATDAIKFTVSKNYAETTAPEVVEAAVATEASVPQFEIQTVPSLMSDQAGMSAEEIARQQAAISCSLDNPDGCEMCSG